jgi:hypothetical protein
MITFEQAKQIAVEKIGTSCAILESKIIEKPYGWYFIYQSKCYIETQDFRDMLVGSAGFIVESDTGKIFEFCSAYPLDDQFSAYELGLKYDYYDLTVQEVYIRQQAIELLLKLNMSYVLPEEAHGEIWTIPKPYTHKQISEMLQSLPCTFSKQRFRSLETAKLLNLKASCKLHLAGYYQGA